MKTEPILKNIDERFKLWDAKIIALAAKANGAEK